MSSQRILREVACDVVNRVFFEHENFMMLLNYCGVSVRKHSLVEIVAALDLLGGHTSWTLSKNLVVLPHKRCYQKKKTSAETVGQHPQREKKAITFTLNAGALTFAFLHTIGRALECTRCVQFTTVRHVQRRQASSPRDKVFKRATSWHSSKSEGLMILPSRMGSRTSTSAPRTVSDRCVSSASHLCNKKAIFDDTGSR